MKPIALSLALALMSAGPGLALGLPPDPAVKPDFDLRLPTGPGARAGLLLREPTAEQQAAAMALAAEYPGVRLRWDGISGAPKWIAAAPGDVLAPPAPGDPAAVARAFVSAHARLFGLTARELDRLRVTSVVPSRSGGHHVHFVQVVGGIDVFRSHLNVNLDREGAVRSLGTTLFARLRPRLTAPIGPLAAARAATESCYENLLPPVAIATQDEDATRLTIFEGTGFAFPPRARLVIFPLAEGSRLAWEVVLAEAVGSTSYRVLIDTEDGRLLHRQNLTFYAEARHLTTAFAVPATEEFAPADDLLETVPASTPESPAGWITDPGTELAGNNVIGHLKSLEYAPLAEPTASYDYPFNTPRSTAVNAWWAANDAHDLFYAIGFDEAAGNFQQDNFGAGGAGGDPIHTVAYTAGLRWAPYFRPWGGVDGSPAYLHLPWLGCRFCGDHDGLPENGGERASAYSRLFLYHEYTHGVTLRVLGGPGDGSCFGGAASQSYAMAEAWSDLFAASFLGDSRGGAALEGFGWNRGLRQDRNYSEYCDAGSGVGGADTGCNAYVNSMIWSAALWELRESMRALDTAGGLADFHELILEGVAQAPCSPTMVDARDALLEADTDLFASAHHEAIWNVFAAHGLGEHAETTGDDDTSPVADETVPTGHLCVPPSAPTGLTASPDGENRIALTYDATGAASVEIWREDVDNPFDEPVRIGFTTSTTGWSDEEVEGGKRYRYHLIGLGAAGTLCASAASGSADATATGSCNAYPIFDPDLTIAAADGSCAAGLSWQAASPACSGEPIVYSVYRAPTPGFEPAERLLIGRTTATSYTDIPPETVEDGFSIETGETYYYLVLAEHGTVEQAADHRHRGSTQLLEWVPGLPTGSRELVEHWSFDSGPEGWTADTAADPVGGWTLADPSPTWYEGALLAPDAASGGTGMAWVTGDAGGPATVESHDCDTRTTLTSPVWDGTGGATILSFDHWTHVKGAFLEGLELVVDNGVESVVLAPVGMMTAQPFRTAGEHGWQPVELDLAELIAPTSTMSVTFRSGCSSYSFATELGVDEVRVERATACSRSSLRLESVIVDDSPAGWGNGNGVLEPGETARLDVTISNLGSATAFAPIGRLVAEEEDLLVHEETASFPDLLAGATGTAQGDRFTVTVPADRSCEESLVLDFDFVDAAGTHSFATWSPEFGYPVDETVLEDDFETDQGWVYGHSSVSGQWEQGDPVGTMHDGNQANPENDSPNDPGSQCYVTENGSVGGDPNASDVDGQRVYLRAPLLDLTGYKRARLTVDLWFYDSGTGDPMEDHGEYRVFVDDSDEGPSPEGPYLTDSTGGWVTRQLDLHDTIPMTDDVQLEFRAWDRNHLFWPGGTDAVVEMGVDNVLVVGELQTCDPLGIDDPPNGIGDTLRVGRSGADIELTWQAAPVDAFHDAAAYYQLFVSDTPANGYVAADTTTLLTLIRASGAPVEFLVVSAVNSAGSSGDEPAP